MIARHLIGKQLGKGVFDITQEVKLKEKEFGKEKVINSTIGSFYGEDENLVVLKIVENLYRNIPKNDLFGYATGISGSVEYKKAVKENVFDEYLNFFKDSFIGVTATPGGTGAIHNTFKGYLDKEETVLLPEFMWEAYIHLAAANDLKTETYSLFDGENFNLKDFKEKILKIIKTQKKVLVVINDPCQNPTGYSLSINEWKEVIKILKEATKYGEIILLNDIAYIDYDFNGLKNSREYMKLFHNLPENILIIFAYSMSKSYTCYGVRIGAQVALSSKKEIIDEFNSTSTFLSRTSWSNSSKGGMKLLSDIYENKDILKQLIKERQEKIDLLKKRADIFLEGAKEIKLKHCPFKSGFFITIPLDKNKIEVFNDLKSKEVFVLPIAGGIRIALCSVPCNKIKKLPKLIKQSIDKF